jgi:MFS family permease
MADRIAIWLRSPAWPRLFGLALFVGMMATGYYYNVTFIQLGLLDLGQRVLGMGAATVARDIGLLAVLTSGVSLLVGFTLARSGRSSDFRLKLRLAFAVVVAQTALSAGTLLVQTPGAFLLWIILASVALGVGVPVTFGLTVDLVPRRERGYVAGVITAIAYFAAPVFSYPWSIDYLRSQMLLIMVPGCLAIGLLAFLRLPLTDALAAQHRDPAFYYGRFTRLEAGRVRPSRSVLALIALMFAVFFIDSLGFVRLTGTPFLVDHAWRSPDVAPRLTISIMHVIAALAGGILYAALDERALFLWTLGLFGMVHLSYTFPIRLAPETSTALAEPIMYAVAVSLYTVLNFALWADLSTPKTITWHAALGVAASAWTATFVSTALALQLERLGVPVALHLRIVDALAVLLFFGLVIYAWLAARPAQRPAPKE